MLHEGGTKNLSIFLYIKYLHKNDNVMTRLQIVLFGFMNNMASHLERSPLIHSYGYVSAGDRPTCIASMPLKSKSFVQHAG